MVAGLGGAVAAARRASSAYEDLSKFAAVFKGESAEVSVELTQFARDIGRSRFEMLKMASGIQDTFVPLGFARDQAADMSVELTRLSEDLASFNNLAGGGTEASQRLTSALVGNHEAVRTFGIVISQARLKEELLRIGMADLTGQALEQAKVQARLNIIMRDTADAHGDAARTARQAENAQRRFMAAVGDTFTGLGMVALPIWREFMNALADFAQDIGPRVVQGAEDMVRGWLQRLGSMEAGTARSLGRTAGFIFAFGQQVMKWGANIVMALAQGITGAINLVVSAVKLIGKVISSLLSPGSPPALLPDLDKWGTEAANVYLEGWTQADFGILDAVGRQVRGILQGQGAEGEGLIGRMAGTRRAVAEAIQRFRQTGQVGVEAYQRIRDAAGNAAEEVVGLVRRQIDLAKASRRVKEINEALTAIEEQRQSIQDAQRLADIQERLAQGGLSAQEEQLALLDAQEIQLKGQLRSAQDEQDERQTELDIFKERLGVQQESIDLSQSLADALTGAAGAAGKIKDGIAGLGDTLKGEIEGAIPDLADLGLVPSFEEEFTNIRDLINKEFKPGFEEGQQIAAEFSTNVEDSINELLTNLGLIRPEDAPVIGMFQEGFAPGAAEEPSSVFDRIGESVGRFGDKLSGLAEAIDNLDTAKIQLIADTIAALGAAFLTFKILSTIATFISFLGGLAGIITGAGGVSSALGGLVALLGGPVTIAIAAIAGAVALLTIAWRRDWGGIQEKTRAVWAKIEPIFVRLINWIKSDIPRALSYIIPVLGILKTAWDNNWGGIQDKVQSVIDWFNENVRPWIDRIVSWFQDLYDDLVGGSIIPELIDRIIGNFLRLADWWKVTFKKVIDTVVGLFNDIKVKVNELIGKDGPLQTLRNVFDRIKSGLDRLIGENGPIQRFLNFLQSMIDKARVAKDMLDKLPFIGDSPPPMEIGLKLVNKQLGEFNDRLGNIGSSAHRVGRDLSDGLASILPGSLPPLAEGLEAVADATRELAGRGRRRLLRFLQAGQQAGQRTATLALMLAWQGLQEQIVDTQDTGEQFVDFWQRDVQEDSFEATDDFLRFDLMRTLEDVADFIIRTLVGAFERLGINASNSIAIVRQAIGEINDLIDQLDVQPLQDIEDALQGIQTALADVAANLPVLQQIRDVLNEIDNIDVGAIVIELNLSAELEARFDTIDTGVVIIQGMINDVRNLVLELVGGGIGLQSVEIPRPTGTRPQFNVPILAGAGGNTTIVNENTFGPFYVSDDMDMELVARKIARIIQDLS